MEKVAINVSVSVGSSLADRDEEGKSEIDALGESLTERSSDTVKVSVFESVSVCVGVKVSYETERSSVRLSVKVVVTEVDIDSDRIWLIEKVVVSDSESSSV